MTSRNDDGRNARTAAIDKVSAIEYHLEGLRELVKQLSEPPRRVEVEAETFAEAELRAFARWTIEMLGLSEVDDVSDQVREARRVLVSALSHGVDLGEARTQRPSGFAPEGHDFTDVFDDEDYEEPEELDIDPIAGVGKI